MTPALFFVAKVVLVFVLCIVIWLVVVLILALAMLWRTQELQFGLPWLRWMTLEDVNRQFWGGWINCYTLHFLHRRGNLETRLRDDNLPEDPAALERTMHSFNPDTVRYHEFRLTKRGGGKRRKWRIVIPPLFGAEPRPI